jgi:signal transduction histidine kinase
MSRSTSADAGLPGAALAPRHWRVSSRLAVLVAIPAVLGLALAGLRVTDTMHSATAYGQVSRLAVLGQQVTGLAQAMEDERTDTATFIAAGRPASGQPALHRQYAVTDGWAASVRGLVLRLGDGYPERTRASAQTVLVSIADLPRLRTDAAQSQTSALAMISGYSAATAGLLGVNDNIADLSGSPALSSSVRALDALSRMKDQAAQQQAILAGALAAGDFRPGELSALTMAQAQQAVDLASFRSSATPEESGALAYTTARPQARQAVAVERRATAAGAGTLALGAGASQQWQAGMSYTVGWMRHAQQQLTDWITAYAQARQRGAARSAAITGGAALTGLLLILLLALIIARSLVRPLRRLEADALDVAKVRLPAEIRALGTPAGSSLARQAPADVHSADEIGRVARALDRVHWEAVQLAGEEARLRGSLSAIFASFFQRSYSLLERQQRLIDSLELGEHEPERLASLFQMDHLATRLLHNADSALILAWHETPRRSAQPTTLVDVLRAALSEIEQYDRVTLDIQSGVWIRGSAAADIVHLLAELLDNATAFSPQETQVVASGHKVRDAGLLIKITDSGGGLPEDELNQLNWQLAHAHLAGVMDAEHVGLCAVAQVAARHGITVTLKPAPAGGTTAEVQLPTAVMTPEAARGGWPGSAGGAARGRAGTGGGTVAVRAGYRPPDASFAARPEPAAGPEPVAGLEFAAGPETATAKAELLPLGAPLPSPVAYAPAAAAAPGPAAETPDAELPIFESVESDYLQSRVRSSPQEPPAGQPALAEPRTAPEPSPASPADRGSTGPAAGERTTAGLPQRVPQASATPVPGPGQGSRPPTAESARAALGKLASFQRGSQRARADRDAQRARQDG